MFSCADNLFNPTAKPSGHIPVLQEPVLELLGGRAGARILDGTFGGGGHTRALLESAGGVHVVALDRDPAAERRALAVSETYGERFTFVRSNFGALGELSIGEFDGILFDFGLSSFQLDEGERGFSFREDAPVDMRMDTESGRTAAEFLEEASEDELIEAIRGYGEEKAWRRVVAAILAARGTGQLQRTRSLAALIEANTPARQPGRRAIHPATRSFQGIRIAVNGELTAIERALPAAFERLKPGGRLLAISFHSLEDRIVKRFTRRVAGRPEHGRDSRTSDERAQEAILLHPKGIAASAEEAAVNPRSRSARLRVIEKLNAQPKELP